MWPACILLLLATVKGQDIAVNTYEPQTPVSYAFDNSSALPPGVLPLTDYRLAKCVYPRTAVTYRGRFPALGS
jgi:hypothetical protein